MQAGLPANDNEQGGNYSATVDHSWEGTVTPTLAGYAFNPAVSSL